MRRSGLGCGLLAGVQAWCGARAQPAAPGRRPGTRLLRLLRLPPLLGACIAAFAADPDPRSANADRARTVAERNALVARFAAEERECQARFIVTACVDDVHLRRRQALAPLRERELQLDDAERSQRAADRKAALTAKKQAAVQRGAEPAPPELRVRKPPAAASAAASTAARAAQHQKDSAARAANAGERAQAAQDREATAQATQHRIAQRQADRAAKGKIAAPLPPAGVASAAGASAAPAAPRRR